MDINLSKLKDIVKDRGTWPTAVHGVINSQTWLSDLIATKTDKGTNSFLGDIYHYSHMGTGIQAPLVLRSRHSRGIPWIAAAKIKIQDEPEIPSDRYWYTGGRQREKQGGQLEGRCLAKSWCSMDRVVGAEVIQNRGFVSQVWAFWQVVYRFDGKRQVKEDA